MGRPDTRDGRITGPRDGGRKGMWGSIRLCRGLPAGIRTAAALGLALALAMIGCSERDRSSALLQDATASPITEPTTGFTEREIVGLLGAELELPQAFPNDIPRYPGAVEIGAVSAAGQGALATFRSSDSPEEIRAFYRHQLTQTGWRVDRETDFAGEHVLSTSKGNRTVSVAITDHDGDTQITLRAAAPSRPR